MVTQVGRGEFLGINHTPYPKGTGPRVPQIFGISYMRAHDMRKATKFCKVIKLRAVEVDFKNLVF